MVIRGKVAYFVPASKIAAGLETRRTTNSHRPGKEYVFSYCPLQFERETVVEPLPGIQAPRSNFKGLFLWKKMNEQKLSPKVIKDWCTKHPDALEKMIAMYGHMQYKQAIDDLMRIGSDLRHIETGAAVILAPLHDFDNWKAGEMCQAKYDAMRVPQKNERVMMYRSDYDYISNCCGTRMKDPSTSDLCPKCKEHCKPVLAELDSMV